LSHVFPHVVAATQAERRHVMDLIIRNGTVVTAGETFQADIGIEGGKIKQLGHGLGPAAKEIDAGGKYLLPELMYTRMRTSNFSTISQ
jgi:dihydroorotase-like cyclic amidohydrolase